MGFDFSNMSAEDLEARKAELLETIDADGADLDAIDTEARAIKAELERRKAEEAKRAEVRDAVAAGAGVTVETKEIKTEERKNMFGIDSIEYRNAWTKNIIGRPVNEEERAALASAAAVIPTMTVNAVWDKLVKSADLMGKVKEANLSLF